MTILAGRLDLAAFRRDPFRVIANVRGVDLTGIALTYGVGLYPDADPAFRLLLLNMTDVPGANGIRLVSVDRSDTDQPVSIYEIIASKDLLLGFPRSGELGDDLIFSHELQVAALPMSPGFTSIETTLFYGTLTIKGSVND